MSWKTTLNNDLDTMDLTWDEAEELTDEDHEDH